jgi:hypothetical protein
VLDFIADVDSSYFFSSDVHNPMLTPALDEICKLAFLYMAEHVRSHASAKAQSPGRFNRSPS